MLNRVSLYQGVSIFNSTASHLYAHLDLAGHQLSPSSYVPLKHGTTDNKQPFLFSLNPLHHFARPLQESLPP